MRRIAGILLILSVFTGLPFVLRLLYVKEMAVYEMALPHCCHAVPTWALWLIVAADFFFSFPSGALPLVSSLSWGCMATLLYLATGKWRRRVKLERLAARHEEPTEGVWPPPPTNK